MNSNVALYGDCHRHENGGRHHDGLAGEEEVGEEDDVKGSRQLEALPEALKDGAKEVARVKHGQRDQHQVERVPHVLGGLKPISFRLQKLENFINKKTNLLICKTI